MPGPVKRRYHSPARREAAAATRTAVLAAARELFTGQGYAGTTMTGIAARAGVSPDTVYAAVGTKAELFALLVETALSGRDEVVPGPRRDFVAAIRAAEGLRAKLAVYAAATTATQLRLAPLFSALQAASGVPELRALWSTITARRAENMRIFAADLRSTGELRTDLTLDEVADVVWTMNGSEHYSALVTDRGWSPERFEQWLSEAWWRLLRA